MTPDEAGRWVGVAFGAVVVAAIAFGLFGMLAIMLRNAWRGQ